MMHLFRMGSRNSVNQERDHAEFRKNYYSIMKVKIPHMDTVDAILEKLLAAKIEQLLQQLVRILLTKRVLHKFRLLGKYFTVAIDGTGLFKFDDEPYDNCPV